MEDARPDGCSICTVPSTSSLVRTMSLPKCCKRPSDGVPPIYSLWASSLDGRHAIVPEATVSAHHAPTVVCEVKDGTGAFDARIRISSTGNASHPQGRVEEPC